MGEAEAVNKRIRERSKDRTINPIVEGNFRKRILKYASNADNVMIIEMSFKVSMSGVILVIIPF